MTNDGTQDPTPQPVLSDPLAGLVTGSRYEPEPLRVRVVEPPMPDISAVREAMASVLDENSELDLTPIGPAADYFTDSSAEVPAQAPPSAAGPATTETAPPAPAAGPAVAKVPVAQLPTQVPVGRSAVRPGTALTVPGQVPRRGAVTRISPPPAIPSPREAARPLPARGRRGERSRRIRLPRGFVRRKPPVSPEVKAPSSAGSVTLIMLLLFVMIVLGIVFLASLIDTIASVFD